ncbi:sigma-70 family RNA polymerase sigma factor [Paenibacillus arenosi]|uniref:Sigma-70 family RNA polymerase sigma factor n=1 Tax=Paenibacillus arenosi TaxID=2774142 RepID=A0ABR9B2D8_9BACL|nr:sigma-70 family RNA polymerase sigma factor [Paenibacillus arenosi]
MSDFELEKRAIAGDDESFSILIEQRKERIYRMAYTYVRNKEDALEIVQETVYKAYLSVEKLQQPQYFNTWLMKIAVNAALDHIRKSKRVVYMDKDIERSYTPDHREEKLDLYEALDSLDEKTRTVLLLRYFEDMSLKDIAETFDAPLSTIKSIVYRGLEKLIINLGEGELLE